MAKKITRFFLNFSTLETQSKRRKRKNVKDGEILISPKEILNEEVKYF